MIDNLVCAIIRTIFPIHKHPIRSSSASLKWDAEARVSFAATQHECNFMMLYLAMRERHSLNCK